MRRLTRYEMSSVDGEIYLDSSNTRLINAAEAKVCLAIDVGDIENDLYEQEEKTKQYKVLYQEKCRDINTQERFFALENAHQKYKRCLAMAKWCDDAARLVTWDTDFHRCRWYNKWMQRWLELAEHYKEAK